MLFFVTKAHNVLDPRAVVPTAIENDDLTRSGKVWHVTLDVHLTLLAIRWRGKRNNTEYAWADALRDRLDGAALSRPIAAFKQEDDTQPLVLHPILKSAKLNLELAQFLCVLLIAHLRLGAVVRV